MKAVVYTEYGSPEVLRYTEVETPAPKDDQVLIKVFAVSINGSDRENLVGRPFYARIGGLRKPRNPILGSDIAGRVEAVGKSHIEFKLGDEVFGEIPGYHGGFAEYVCTDGATMALKPASLTFDEASAIPQAGVIALRGIREIGQVQPGEKVLVNGAGGSGGSYAIQLAKLYGAEVTGVDNAHKQDFMRLWGADHVIDYTKEDFTANGRQYDLILDLVAYRSALAYPRALRADGRYWVVGGSVSTLLQILLLGPVIKSFTRKTIRILAVPQNRKDLLAISALIEARQVIPAIDKVYPFDKIPDALQYISDGYAKGKVVIKVAE